METQMASSRLKRSLGAQALIYLLLGLLYSLPGWSEWLQDKLNFLSTNLLGSTADFVEHSLFQAGAFVLVVYMLYNALTACFDPEENGGKIITNIILNFAYAASGLLFFIFSQTHLMHDLFVFFLFGGLGLWTLLVYRQKPPAMPS